MRGLKVPNLKQYSSSQIRLVNAYRCLYHNDLSVCVAAIFFFFLECDLCALDIMLYCNVPIIGASLAFNTLLSSFSVQ